MSFLGGFKNLFQGLADIIYPRVCLACKNKITESSVDKLICPACWSKIRKNLPPFCHRCGRQLKPPYLTKNICSKCLKKDLHFDRAFSPCIYEGTTKELIHSFKYNNRDHLGQALSNLMVEFIKEYNLAIDVIDYIVPVPLYKTRLREREFNQAQVLSKHIAEEFDKKTSQDILIRNRYTKTQTELETTERYKNVKGSFTVQNEQLIKDKNILLIDDVLTTGATTSEASFALKLAGANIVFVLTLAN